ncbi:MAG: Tol-Pal system beta propeller repeat protein TolB [Sphingomonadales bacterium]
MTCRLTMFARGFAAILILAAGFVMSPRAALAVLEVDITRGYMEPLPIAIPDFVFTADAQTPEGPLSKIGRDIANVIAADLARSGLFRAISRDAFIRPLSASEVRPDLRIWKAVGAQALVAGRMDRQADGSLAVEFRLWDVLGESQMTGMRYTLPAKNWRRVAHIIADAVYKRLTGEDGYFDTRVVFISETGVKTNRVKRLTIMDQDGANLKYLTSGRDLVLTPRFSPSQQEITYFAYYNDRPRVYLYNLESGKHEVLGDFPNMTFAPRFTPDGNGVIFSQAINGNSDIYEMDLRTRRVRRLTDDPGIDTSPSYAPDGMRLVFNSDRGGSQQLYVMDRNGGNVERISFGRGRYGTPVWSPRGDLIAFTKIDTRTRQFRIGVMRPDGSGERMLTDAYQDEGPTWSPNGRVLMFFRTERYRGDGSGGEVSLWSVDLTGYNERRVPTPTDASDPAWSPLIQ